MKTIQLTLDLRLFRGLELSKTPKIFIEGKPQREKLDSPPELPKHNPSPNELLELINGYSFPLVITGKEEEIYDRMNAFFKDREKKYEWRGWGLRDELFCYLVDFWRLPSSDPQNVASNKQWWTKIEDLKRAFKALNQCDQRKTPIDYNYEDCTLQFTPKEIKAKVQEMIRKIVEPFGHLSTSSVSRNVYDLVNREDFEQAQEVLKSLKRARNQDNALSSVFAQQIYDLYEQQHLIRKQIKSKGQIVQQGTETHVFQLISEFLEYAGLLPALDSKATGTHHDRGKRKIKSYKSLKENYTTEEGVVIMVLKT
jgi:BMFP domain-containing protein YqiC